MNHIRVIAFGSPCSFVRHVQQNPSVAAMMKDALRAGQLERITHKTSRQYGEYMDILKRWGAKGAVPFIDEALAQADRLKCIECEGDTTAQTADLAEARPA